MAVFDPQPNSDASIGGHRDGKNRYRNTAVPIHSGLIFASRTTLPHSSVSPSINLA
jgi:hypothetical protein